MARAGRVSLALTAVAFVALALAGGGAVLADKKDVSGTKHDLAAGGVSPCVSCHLPRDTSGELLWARDPIAGTDFSGLKPLCFSCHDGTVTDAGAYAFNPGLPEHVSNPGIKGQDCDRCHDPHETGGSGKFLKLPGGAGFCQNCHPRAGPADHPVDVDAAGAGVFPKDSEWDPEAGDFSGTRLWDEASTGPGGQVKCLTCHSPHGGQPDTEINSMAFSTAQGAFLPLCQNCHYGWGDQRGDAR